MKLGCPGNCDMSKTFDVAGLRGISCQYARVVDDAGSGTRVIGGRTRGLISITFSYLNV